jgi:hypothetical protein
MAKLTRIVTVERDSDDGIFVTFSDGTTAGYVIEELLEMRRFREQTYDPRNLPPNPLG